MPHNHSLSLFNQIVDLSTCVITAQGDRVYKLYTGPFPLCVVYERTLQMVAVFYRFSYVHFQSWDTHSILNYLREMRRRSVHTDPDLLWMIMVFELIVKQKVPLFVLQKTLPESVQMLCRNIEKGN